MLTEAGAIATVLDVSSYDYGEVNTMLGVDGEETVTSPVDEFFSGCSS